MNTFKNESGTLHEEHKPFHIRYCTCKCRQYSKLLVFAPLIVATRGTLFSKANNLQNIELYLWADQPDQFNRIYAFVNNIQHFLEFKLVANTYL